MKSLLHLVGCLHRCTTEWMYFCFMKDSQNKILLLMPMALACWHCVMEMQCVM